MKQQKKQKKTRTLTAEELAAERAELERMTAPARFPNLWLQWVLFWALSFYNAEWAALVGIAFVAFIHIGSQKRRVPRGAKTANALLALFAIVVALAVMGLVPFGVAKMTDGGAYVADPLLFVASVAFFSLAWASTTLQKKPLMLDYIREYYSAEQNEDEEIAEDLRRLGDRLTSLWAIAFLILALVLYLNFSKNRYSYVLVFAPSALALILAGVTTFFVRRQYTRIMG